MAHRKGTIERSVGVLAIMMSVFCTGCGADNILYEGKEKCNVIISENITISYDNSNYVVLTEQIPKDKVGEWVGYVNENISGAMFSTVYLGESAEEICVAVDDSFYKAVKAERLEANQVPMHSGAPVFKETICLDGMEVNQENATQLLCGEKVYQVTEEEISGEQVGNYLLSISAYIVFDKDTKQVLSQKEYAEIDWDGTKSEGENRDVWVYTDVREIKDPQEDSIAVKVNGTYHIAVLLN